MPTIKTADLIGPALDFTVNKCYGGIWESAESFKDYHEEGGFNYSTDWSQGGPIIERERIEITPPVSREDPDQTWMSVCVSCDNIGLLQVGPTPLIAAMRCFVTSRLGDTVEISEGLL